MHQISMSQLIEMDPRWNIIKETFIHLCTKPDDTVVFSEKEQKVFEESHAYPESFDEIDRWEHEYRMKGTVAVNDNTWTRCFGKYSIWSTTVQRDPRFARLGHYIRHILGGNVQLRGVFYYPPGGFREWHSNKYDPPGYRLYLVRSMGDSTFQYINQNKEMVRVPDGELVLNIFKVGTGDNTLYHNVVSNTDRWSIGFLCDEDRVDALLKMISESKLVAP